jgi:hypothetical protein
VRELELAEDLPLTVDHHHAVVILGPIEPGEVF